MTAPAPGPLGGGGLLEGEACPSEVVEAVAGRLEAVQARIVGAGGDPGRVRVLAVTKGFGPAAVRAALALGLGAVGESYVGELVAKAGRLAELEPGARVAWHFLGAVQRNKVGRLAPYVARYEGVDRLEEGEAIARHAPGARVLVEVDCSGREGRGGVAPGEARALVGALRARGLVVEGLMTVAPQGDPVAAGRTFSLVAELVAELGLEEASMGMSDDLEAAVAAGSTMLRLGRALFGSRRGVGEVPE